MFGPGIPEGGSCYREASVAVSDGDRRLASEEQRLQGVWPYSRVVGLQGA